MTDAPRTDGPSHRAATDDGRTALRATIIGSVAILVTMALHPTGRETLDTASHGGSNWLVRAVHVLAIAALPLLTAGMRTVSTRLETVSALARPAFIAYGLGIVAVMIAAAASGFIAPALADAIPATTGIERSVLVGQFHYTGLVNQAFATLYVALSGAAFVAWAIAMRRDPAFRAGVAWYGLIAGAVPLLGVLTGHLRLDVHGFGLVVVLQTTFMAWAAWSMARQGSPARSPTPA